MLPFILITAALAIGIVIANAYGNYEAVRSNWGAYRSNLMYLVAAPMFKPDDDPRTPTQFAVDNFNDVTGEYIKTVLRTLLEPLFGIFRLLLNGADEMLSGILNMRGGLSRLWEGWNSVTQVFFHRFANTANAFQGTWRKLYEAMGRTYGVAVSSLYGGLASIYSMLSSLDLMVNIAIAALIVIISLMFFFWFVLWPVIPLAIAAVAFISNTASAAGVSGMASALSGCFAAETLVALEGGRQIPVCDVRIGDVLRGGGVVTGTMVFEHTTDDVFEVEGVYVSGCHILYDGAYPISVEDSPDARLVPGFAEPVYCLLTSDRRIPIVTGRGRVRIFGDWEELPDDLEAQTSWHIWVDSMLNRNGHVRFPDVPEPAQIGSQAAFSGAVRVLLVNGGYAEIQTLRPGHLVMSAEGKPAHVTGVVRVGADEVDAVAPLDLSGVAFASAGIWLRGDTASPWMKPNTGALVAPPKDATCYYHLFTSEGTFRVAIGDSADPIDVRDFSDVGMVDLQKSYGWVLGWLRSAGVSAKNPKC
jgi:hypothetical protein